MSEYVNCIVMPDGRLRAVCEYCGKVSEAVNPDFRGKLSIYILEGWAEAPFADDYVHDDGSKGSLWHCPDCCARQAAGEGLFSRDERPADEHDVTVNDLCPKCKRVCSWYGIDGDPEGVCHQCEAEADVCPVCHVDRCPRCGRHGGPCAAPSCQGRGAAPELCSWCGWDLETDKACRHCELPWKNQETGL